MAFFVAIDQIARKVDAGVGEFQKDRDRFIRVLNEAARDIKTGT
jgi:hypothetical protein